ncbi:hypothetical protein K435DRAFT_93680 [Dendrothele bispora CBS 962.96]|uniref:Uncharacterized protein n=1 Tax=Dendrothele bispora (strain CBS 962.96) TaxID=1314807 RepID=A0A4S8MSI9_DENBC|nr:hypothetical protein K435DRAFT_93680 [Dendrothele bispora CBS 962.96]
MWSAWVGVMVISRTRVTPSLGARLLVRLSSRIFQKPGFQAILILTKSWDHRIFSLAQLLLSRLQLAPWVRGVFIRLCLSAFGRRVLSLAPIRRVTVLSLGFEPSAGSEGDCPRTLPHTLLTTVPPSSLPLVLWTPTSKIPSTLLAGRLTPGLKKIFGWRQIMGTWSPLNRMTLTTLVLSTKMIRNLVHAIVLRRLLASKSSPMFARAPALGSLH